MQLRKGIALLAATVVGLSLGSADAANVTSVSVVSPDSGVVRGIDSTFTISAVVEDFSPETRDGVLLFLWTGNDSTGVVTGATVNATLPDSGGTQRTAAVIRDTVTTTALGGNSATWVAVGITADTVAVGSSDSVWITQDNASNLELKTYHWRGKVSSSVGTHSGVRVSAIAYDATEKSYSTIASSPASRQFRIDGDRPTSPDAIITVSSAIARPAGHLTTAGFPAIARDIFDFPRGGTTVLGVGDTIVFNVKLGSAATSVLSSGSLLTVQASLFGKPFSITTNGRSLDTLKFRNVITAGQFDNLMGSQTASTTDTFNVWVVDGAGNRSDVRNTDVATALGVTVAATFLVDGKLPVLDGQVVAADTILPVSNDTITDGGPAKTVGGLAVVADANPITYNLAEALDSLFIGFSAGGSVTLWNVKDGTDNTDAALGLNNTINVNISSHGNSDSLVWVRLLDGGTEVAAGVYDTVGADPGTAGIKSGLQTLTFQGVDLSGNKGPVLTRTNVYVDVDELSFERLFPTSASALDTIEEETAKVIFRLSEDADSVLVRYTPLAGNGTVTREKALVGPQLTSDLEQTITIDSLVTGTSYKLQLVGADLAGNYTATAPDTFVYDTTYVVPVIASFQIKSTSIAILTGSSGTKYRPAAGDTVTLTLQAKTIAGASAVTYKEAATLKITNSSGLIVTGTGLTAVSGIAGRYTLSADDWITGSRTVKLIDTTATIDSTVTASRISVTVVDSSDTNSIYTGTIDTTIVTLPAALSNIGLTTVSDTVGQGDAFWVSVGLADKFGNARPTDAGFVEVATNAIGVQIPINAISISKGVGGFWANANGYAGALTITARGITGVANGQTGTLSVYVDGNGATVLDDPDTLIAQDYKGASGNGDQGGFILLTFPASDDHATLSGYRIYRELSVDYAADSTGALVALAEPTMAMTSWGTVDAVPGQSIMRVVVATLDGDSTSYGVAAERGGLSSKEAFDVADAVSTPYELMAQTMLQSKEVAQLDPNAPVFATLTPEALAFSANGVVPRLKTVDDILQSNIRASASAVRAIDDIAPAPIMSLLAQDTQGDIGGSITVRWTQSADDRMLTTTVPNAIGDMKTFTTAGVAGYNIYRRIGDAAWQMVGQAAAGATSFEDATVFNGVRYAYKVEARDADNVTDSGLERSAMAIRNNVEDVNGQRVLGLFGADTKVDDDDFFIFADHFGMTAGADGFDLAFDLSPNNAIDIADFFVFADNFGREIVGVGKVVPTMAGLNSDARFYLDAGAALPSVGAELSVAVSLEDFVEVRGYGLTVEFDNQLLEFVGARVVDNALGEAELAAPQMLGQQDGKVSIAAFGETVSEGGLGLNLVFRATQEIESSYIELTSGALQDGSYGLNRITSPVSIRVETRPEVYALEDNYPNPFNPETTIKYQLPEAGQVTLEVYNMLGQVVKTLVNNQFQNAGRYTLQWDATNNSGQPLSSGVYFYRILAGGEFQSHKKMLLLK